MNFLDFAPADALKRIETLLKSEGFERYRAKQVFDWLWAHPASSWSETANLPTSLVSLLEKEAPILRPRLLKRQESRDGTSKFLWGFADGAVESVLIPEGKRSTLCISSQVGCAFGCVFCSTGTMGFGRNLAPWEITAQIRELLLLGIGPGNVVFMGMGEPLHNWKSVDTALTQLNSPAGFGIGARHITLSTVGLLPQLAQFVQRKEQFRLAISLHSAHSKTRQSLMPVERKYPLAQLKKLLKDCKRRTTLEYVMVSEVNDSEDAATDLAKFANDISAHVNLLPLHPGARSGLKPSSADTINRFAKYLSGLGTPVTVRRSRGKDIDAACGQLALKN